MRAKILESPDRTIAVVFDVGDEVVGGLKRIAAEHGLSGCHFTGIGAFSDVLLGYWDPSLRTFSEIRVSEQVEALSITGNVALDGDGEPQIHAHVVIGKRDGTAHGGHLLQAHVRPTLEIVMVESPRHLRRRIDPESQLPLLIP